jgi:hypothetical protein
MSPRRRRHLPTQSGERHALLLGGLRRIVGHEPRDSVKPVVGADDHAVVSMLAPSGWCGHLRGEPTSAMNGEDDTPPGGQTSEMRRAETNPGPSRRSVHGLAGRSSKQ